ncbi:MAG: hypothetical protein JXA43_02995 [Candidatus Diapherotrites archaeon]|nr:hypothetical protein [Candidatus Diapherotrites archaeon]
MDLLSELYKLMIKYHFKQGKSEKRFILINSEILKSVAKDLNAKKDETVFVRYANAGFAIRELKSKIIVADAEPYIKVLKGELKNIKIVNLSEKVKAEKLLVFPPINKAKEETEMAAVSKATAILLLPLELDLAISAYPGEYDYSATSVIIQILSEIKEKKIVLPAEFYPRAESKMYLIKLKPKKSSIKDADHFKKFISGLFKYKNRTIQKALKLANKENNWKLSDEKIESVSLDEKVFLITPKEFEKIYCELF